MKKIFLVSDNNYVNHLMTLLMEENINQKKNF